MSARAAEGPGAPGPLHALLRHAEVPALVLTPALMVACLVADVDQTAILTLLVAGLGVACQFASFETSRPTLRQLMPAVVLGAVAAAGRLLFAPIPDFKPVAAITIMAGTVFGRQTGFLVGAMAALVSNFFMGQGPWTPWQMYSWGLVGFLAGVLESRGCFSRRGVLYAFGLAAGLLYGAIMDTWNLIGFVRPITAASAALNYAMGLPHNVVHGVSTMLFLAVIYAPWNRKLLRIKEKYDLAQDGRRWVERRRREREDAGDVGAEGNGDRP